MKAIMLTQQERDKFATWLEQEIESDKAISGQMETMPHLKMLVDKMRMEMKAALIIVAKLRSIEDMTIGE